MPKAIFLGNKYETCTYTLVNNDPINLTTFEFGVRKKIAKIMRRKLEASLLQAKILKTFLVAPSYQETMAFSQFFSSLILGSHLSLDH